MAFVDVASQDILTFVGGLTFRVDDQGNVCGWGYLSMLFMSTNLVNQETLH